MWRYLRILLGLVLLGSAVVKAERIRYDNYTLYHVLIESEDQLKELRAVPSSEFLFVYEPGRVGQKLDIIVAPDEQLQFHDFVTHLGLKAQLKVANIQTLIDKEYVKSRNEGFGWDAFHSTGEIYAWMDSLAETYPNVVTRVKGGDSYEGRSIEGVQLSKNPENPTIFIESQIHGNEWICSSGATWIINELLTSTDPDIQELMNNFNWYIFPVANPDGYEYSRNTERMWRKTRSRGSLLCWGVDPNRNFDFQWTAGVDGIGASNDPCHYWYSGTHPFSEIEPRTLSEFALSKKDEIKVFLSLHSAIRMILSSWGYTNEKPDNYEDLMAIMTAANEHLFDVHGMEYRVGATYDLMYPANGLATDWARGVLGVDISLTYEFRDEDIDGEFYGFLPPPSEIIPNAQEVLYSFVGLTRKARELGYFD